MAMSEQVQAIVHLSIALVFLETFFQLYRGNKDLYYPPTLYYFIGAYLLCIVTDYFHCSSFTSHEYVRHAVSVMHALDGVAAFVIGYGILTRNNVCLILGILSMSKCGFIHVLNRMILFKTTGFSVLQTTKSYFHHTASFFFLRSPFDTLLTLVWRALSMTGHAMLVFRRVSWCNGAVLYQISLCLSVCRIAFTAALLWLCWRYPAVQTAFAYNAVGHIAYILIRVVPTFQTGGAYLSEAAKADYLAMSDADKLTVLLRGNHKLLSLELLLLSALAVYFASLRVLLLVDQIHAMQYGAPYFTSLFVEDLSTLPAWDSWKKLVL